MTTPLNVFPIAGMWAGPSYAGGWNFPSGSDPQGEVFRRLYGDIANNVQRGQRLRFPLIFTFPAKLPGPVVEGAQAPGASE